MLESSIFGLIGSPLACLLLLVVAGVIAARVTLPRKRRRYTVIEEMSEPTPEQKAQWELEDEAHDKKQNDIGAWWNP